MSNIHPLRILGIDPGYERLGLAVIERTENPRREKLLFSACFKTLSSLPHAERLNLLGTEVKKVIDEYSPTALAIETLFFQNNQKTAFKVAEARGAIIYQAKKKGLTVTEFTPLQIKTAITSYGRSDKSQIKMMVKKLISIDKTIKYDDEYDAIAIGLTYFAYYR